MHLIELKEKLDGIQAERGNVLLSHALLKHEGGVLVAHGESVDEGIHDLLELPLEERLARCGPGGCVPVTTDELTQLVEYRTELLEAYDTGRNKAGEPIGNVPAPVRMLALVPPAGLIEAALDQLAGKDGPEIVAQEKELHVAMGDDAESEDLRRGYNIGLETARVCLEATPAVQLAEAEKPETLQE